MRRDGIQHSASMPSGQLGKILALIHVDVDLNLLLGTECVRLHRLRTDRAAQVDSKDSNRGGSMLSVRKISSSERTMITES